MFASSSRLDLGISVRLQKLGDIKTVLSDPLPIFIKFRITHTKTTGGDNMRMRAALKQYRARVREIFFVGESAGFDKYFKKFSQVTGCNFPVLESLSMDFRYRDTPKLINTFIGGPDLSNLLLRRFFCINIQAFIVLNVSHRPLSAHRFCPQPIIRDVSCRLFARHVLPALSHSVHATPSPRGPIAAFNSQRYCRALKFNTIHLLRPQWTLERSRGRAFGSISPRYYDSVH
jgi:hypothetical protein